MTKTTQHTIIPEGELKCIWMEAGLVAYKLCDREYRCEECPFDEVIRQHHGKLVDGDTVHEAAGVRPDLSETEQPHTAAEHFRRALDAHLLPFDEPELPHDRLYHRSHTWVQEEKEMMYRVGIDHCAIHLLGMITSVVLPQAPVQAFSNAPCVWLIHSDGAVALRSPIPGRVTQVNAALRDHPHLINGDPYNNGWLLRITQRPVDTSGDDLLTAEKMVLLLQAQAHTLRKELLRAFKRLRPHIGQTMYDGGRLVTSIVDVLGPKKYFEIVSRVFKPQ